MLASLTRPSSWDFPLLLHVGGAMLLVGTLTLAALALTGAVRRDDAAGAAVLTRYGFRTLLYAVLPSFILMRVAAEWIADKEGLNDLDNPPDWIDIGYMVSDIGLLLLIAALITAGLASRRVRAAADGDHTVGSRAAQVLTLILLAAYAVAVFAMSGKPG
jgi:hypothetical protein